MKKILLASLLFVLTSLKINAQCFEIESILVDGCDGGNEGQNEMVTFRVGSVALNTANLTVTWPNGLNPWLGICQNTTTAAKVAAINSSITACGLLVEPVGGVLPANSKILMITSESMNPNAQSFANLSETLTVIFQCTGNTSGHFANFGTGTRTLTMNFSSPPGCSDVVVYDRAQLLNQSQVPGAQDGGAVLYNAVGTPTYINNGCAVPAIPLTINANISNTTCVGLPQNITTTVTGGAYTNIAWAGGTGTFAATSGTNTSNTYTPGVGDAGVITLSATVTRTCTGGGTTANTTFTFAITPSPTLNLSASSLSICGTQSANIVALSQAGNTFSWSTGATTNSISVSPTVTTIYTVTASNSCSNTSTTATVTPGAANSITASASTNTLCSGNSVTLTANSAAGTYSWNTGAITNSIVVSPNTTTAYSVTSAGCTTVSAAQTITVTPLPTLSLNTNSFNICGTQTATIVANSNISNYLWSNGATSNSIVVSAGGVYTVTSANTCTSASQTATVTTGAAPSITLNSSANTLCNGQNAIINLAGSTGTINWSTGATTNSISVNNSGVYTATLVNDCGTATNSITINSAPSPTFNLSPASSVLCPGQTVSLSASPIPLTYSLNWAGSGIVGSSNFNSIVVNSAGIYTLTATDIVTGCSSSSLVTVTSGNTNAYFTPDVNTGNPPLNVNFNNQSTGANTYSWSLGNGSTSTNTNTSSTYNSAGVYTVTLYASANGQCPSQYTVEIIVKDGLGLIPEVVTSNGDGKNDFFEIKGLYENYPQNKLEIYNRWGNLVYSSTPYKNDWNGTPNAAGKTGSNKLPTGTYYFILQLNDVNQTSFKGFVQLQY
jgi:gliding motility-associated-like protein